MYTKILAFIALSISAVAASEFRFWTVDDGKIFKAKYESFSNGSLSLTNEAGRQARFAVKDMGVADRFYLHEEHDIPLEDLEGGNILSAEEDISIRARDFEEIDRIELEGEGYNVVLEGYLTPRYAVLYEKGLKVEEFVEALERVHYSHSYRHPRQNELVADKRKAYLFIEDGELYDELGKAHVDDLRAQGQLEEREILQIEADWSILRGHQPWHLPEEYQKKFNSGPRADIQFPNPKKSDREKQLVSFYNQKWWLDWPHRRRIHARVPGTGAKHIKDDRENSIAFTLTTALQMNNDIRTFETNTKAFGSALENSSALVTGRFGESDKWASELADKVKSGAIKVDFSIFYRAPENIPPTTKEQYRNFGLLVAGAGRFMEHDLEHMFGVCRLTAYMSEHNKLPTESELPAILGYESMEELNAAFEEFLLRENRRMKP
ncbi:hypothetical protein ACFPK9_12575 [Rubritalea spongiae]|uniref:SLA1 homology domain-containing protein n=1 Tax=Rubritalea spongiae TaxID=430797 RepID=A0ABW5E5T3_9BACT